MSMTKNKLYRICKLYQILESRGRIKKPELLIPAGSIEKLKLAVLYGADAIYIGTPDLSLRTSSNFTLEELIEAIAYAHSYNRKVYLTLNLFSHNKDIEKLPLFIDTIKQAKPDGVIIADPGVFNFVKQHAPELELHISTQANVCSWLSVNFWQEQGASLCVLARETSCDEIKEIREKCPNIKLETFVHGSMCMTYSGRCLLSNFMAEPLMALRFLKFYFKNITFFLKTDSVQNYVYYGVIEKILTYEVLFRGISAKLLICAANYHWNPIKYAIVKKSIDKIFLIQKTL